MTKYVAVDLGAESGRVVLGQLESGKLQLREAGRFANEPVHVHDHLHWDVLRIWHNIKDGLRNANRMAKGDLRSIGLDTWGVDFGLLAADGSLLANPFHYRDQMTNGMIERATEVLPREEIYELTGIQFLQLNSLYQLLALVKNESPILDKAETFLHTPDLFNFWLSGVKANEFTIATTSQCYDPRAGNWALGLLEQLEIPLRIFGDIVPPGTQLGLMPASVAGEIGIDPVMIVAPATHDTGSAVAAVPTDENSVFLSSGTWSIMGMEVPEPIISDAALNHDFTNEGGVNGTFRFSKNIVGLWLIQECRREWGREGKTYGYAELNHLAEETPEFGPLIVPEDPRFLPPGGMPARIREFCEQTSQENPNTHGAIVRCALESLALAYRHTLTQLEGIVGKQLPVIRVFGGGSQNRLLNQFTADACARTVVAGPVEATAAGNVLVQAIAEGDIDSLADARSIVQTSFELETFEPRRTNMWDQAHERYLALQGRLPGAEGSLKA